MLVDIGLLNILLGRACNQYEIRRIKCIRNSNEARYQ